MNLVGFKSYRITRIGQFELFHGSASIAIAIDSIKKYGVDSQIGLIISTIVGSTETTLYTIAIYTKSVGIKRTRFVLLAGLIADIIGMSTAVIIWHFLS